MASTFIYGLALTGFRAIGAETQRIAPLRDINFLIGPNNSGKSTVLRFLSKYLHGDTDARVKTWQRTFDQLDVNTSRGSQISFEIAVRTDALRAAANEVTENRYIGSIDQILSQVSDGELTWMRGNGRELQFVRVDLTKLKGILDHAKWSTLWSKLTAKSGGGMTEHWIPESIARMQQMANVAFPPVKLIPAIREIGAAGQKFDDYSGRGLIDKLAELQNPPHDERSKRDKFEEINRFLRAVTDSADATIEVPHDRRHLLVHMDGKVLPLDSLGTGVHEVVMLAAFCTLVENEIVCIEEPEIHLHPLLQRKLMRFLRDDTKNQYFVATHSASLIDSVSASVFSVGRESGEARIRLAASPAQRYEICKELGYKASDLLQSNAVIWVEGPSDRIYLNHWIRSIAGDLVEGIDYSVMFYGGRLLSHLTPNDPEVDEFISLRRLNRNIAIVIDSDRDSSHKPINKTKRRVIDELSGDFAWLTAGREIENYISPSAISNALRKLHGAGYFGLVDIGRYGDRMSFYSNAKKTATRQADKIKVARAVASEAADLSQLDLRQRMEELVRYIRKSNILGS